MPTSSVRRAGALLELAQVLLPRAAQSDGNFRDWAVVAPAMVGYGAASLEAIFQLPPPRHHLQAEVLARSLTDYAITFAWIAAASDERERNDRLGRLEKTEWLQREKDDKRFTDVLPARGELYRRLMDEGHIPTGLLDEGSRQRLAAVKDEEGLRKMPSLLDRAVEADARWLNEIPALANSGFAALYGTAYAAFSFVAHASVTGVAHMVRGIPPDLQAGVPTALGDAQGPYGLSSSVFTAMLLVASRALGWPEEAAVLDATATALPPGT